MPCWRLQHACDGVLPTHDTTRIPCMPPRRQAVKSASAAQATFRYYAVLQLILVMLPSTGLSCLAEALPGLPGAGHAPQGDRLMTSAHCTGHAAQPGWQARPTCGTQCISGSTRAYGPCQSTLHLWKLESEEAQCLIGGKAGLMAWANMVGQSLSYNELTQDGVTRRLGIFSHKVCGPQMLSTQA